MIRFQINDCPGCKAIGITHPARHRAGFIIHCRREFVNLARFHQVSPTAGKAGRMGNPSSESCVNNFAGFSLDLPEVFLALEAFSIDFIDVFRS